MLSLLNYIYRLTDEIDAVVGTKKVIDFNDIAQMSYLDMVWKETLRLNPPSIATIRVTGQDDSQVLGGYKLPPDSDVHVCRYFLPKKAGDVELFQH